MLQYDILLFAKKMILAILRVHDAVRNCLKCYSPAEHYRFTVSLCYYSTHVQILSTQHMAPISRLTSYRRYLKMLHLDSSSLQIPKLTRNNWLRLSRKQQQRNKEQSTFVINHSEVTVCIKISNIIKIVLNLT